MHDSAINGVTGPVVDNPLVGMLLSLADQARRGQIVAAGVIAITGSGKFNSIASPGAECEIYTGCGALQASLLQSMMRQPSRILRPASPESPIPNRPS